MRPARLCSSGRLLDITHRRGRPLSQPASHAEKYKHNASVEAVYHSGQFCPGCCVHVIVITPHTPDLGTQRHRQHGGLRTRLFSTGAKLWNTSAITRVIDKLSAGDPRLRGRRWRRFPRRRRW